MDVITASSGAGILFYLVISAPLGVLNAMMMCTVTVLAGKESTNRLQIR
jgi:hypothetical protein